MDGVQMKWDWLCSELIEAGDEYTEVIILWIIIIWFPWLLYVIEIAHNKLKLQGKLVKTLSYRTRVRLIISSQENVLLQVNIKISGEIRFSLKKQICVANRTGPHLLHEMRSDWIMALVWN